LKGWGVQSKQMNGVADTGYNKVGAMAQKPVRKGLDGMGERGPVGGNVPELLGRKSRILSRAVKKENEKSIRRKSTNVPRQPAKASQERSPCCQLLEERSRETRRKQARPEKKG